MMTLRRDLLIVIVASLGVPSLAGAQLSVPRIAIVLPNVPIADMQGPKPADGLTDRLVARLNQLGYVEGKSLSIERRSAEGKSELLPKLMKEMVDLRVDVIVTLAEGAMEARKATSTIPIVAYVGDPIASGLTASIRRPTQNVTGVTLTSSASILGKSLQLLKQAIPAARRVAMIDFKYVDSVTTPGTHRRRVAAEAAARELGLILIPIGVDTVDDFEPAFALLERERPEAMVDVSTTFTVQHRRRIIDFAARQRLPTIYGCRSCVEEGGLMSYGEGDSAQPERMADYVDKILKGTNVADLPFQEPTRFDLVINLKTAALLRLTIPESLLLIAEVINK